VQVEIGDDTGGGRKLRAVELDALPDDRIAVPPAVRVGEAQPAVGAGEDRQPELGQGLGVDAEVAAEVDRGPGR